MFLRAIIRKIKVEKRGIAILLVFLILSTGFNFSMGIIGSVVQNIDNLTKRGNTIIVVTGITVENLSKYGEVIDYQYFNEVQAEINGKNITVFAGYGKFKTLGVESPTNGKCIVIGGEAHKGAKIRIGNNEYTVENSYFYISSRPMILTQNRGSTLFVLMNTHNFSALSHYVRTHGKILQFMIWKKGESPASGEIEQIETFVLTLFLIVIFSTLLIIFFLAIAHVYGELKGIGILKAIGLPDRFISSLFTGTYLLLSSTGYFVGSFIGILLASLYSYSLISLPFILNWMYIFKYNFIVYFAIIIFISLPYFIVRRIEIIHALRGSFYKISKLKYILVFAIMFFAIFTPYVVSQEFENESLNIPFDVMILGDVSNLSMGEKAGLIYGVHLYDTLTEAFFMDYNSTFISTIIVGHWFSSPNEVVIGYALSKKYGLQPGDSVRIEIAGKWDNYTVTGVSSCALQDYSAIYLPKVSYVKDTVIFLKTSHPEKIKKEFDEKGYEVWTRDDLLHAYNSRLSLLNTLVGSIILSLLMVSIFSLFTLIYMDIKRNEKVYASLKATGVPNSFAYREFIPKVFLSSLLGLLVVIYPSLLTGEKIHDIVLPTLSNHLILPSMLTLGISIIGVLLVASIILIRKIMNRINVIIVLRG